MTPGIHLPEAILCVNITLCEKQIMLCGGINIRNAHLIAVDIYGTVQAIELNFPVNFWERFWCDCIWQITLEIICSASSCNHSECDDYDQPSHQKGTNFFHCSSGESRMTTT